MSQPSYLRRSRAAAKAGQHDLSTYYAKKAIEAGEIGPMDAPPTGRKRGRKTAHVPAGHANGGQFTGESNPPRALSQSEINQMTREARQSTKLAREKRQRKPKPETLKAIRHTGKDIDPYGPPDPRDLRYAYGTDKLDRALQDYTMDRLKMAADKVQREHPGTKPASRAKKQALIDYIVKYHDAPASQPKPAKAAPKPRRPRKGEPGYAPPVRKPPARDSEPLRPIRRDLPYHGVDPTAPPDPKWLVQAYGERQLGRALRDYTVDMLKQTAERVQREHPNAPKPDKRSKAAIIAYIVKYHDAPASQPRPAEPPRKRKQPTRSEALRKMAVDAGESYETMQARADYHKGRKRKPSSSVPRQGRRTRRNTQESVAVYSEARRAAPTYLSRERAKRRRYKGQFTEEWLNTKVTYGGKVMPRHKVLANLNYMGYSTDKAMYYMEAHGLA